MNYTTLTDVNVAQVLFQKLSWLNVFVFNLNIPDHISCDKGLSDSRYFKAVAT